MSIAIALVWAHAFATLCMAGLVWFVQIVHYPLFARVGDDAFTPFEREHQSRTTWIVAPLMLTELATAILMLVVRPTGVPGPLLYASAALVGVVWLLTFVVSVPLHSRLSRGFDADTHRQLVLTNWPRTLAWTARGVIAIAIVHTATSGTDVAHVAQASRL
jgi:hypothetical protein